MSLHCAGALRWPPGRHGNSLLFRTRRPPRDRKNEDTETIQVMANSERDVIDFTALERELQTAVESERKHLRENDAKLRAVSQRVSYSQFRDLVLSCHLKPLDRKDKDGAPRKQPWNPVTPSNQ